MTLKSNKSWLQICDFQQDIFCFIRIESLKADIKSVGFFRR
jgi:hypothetical protein